MMVLVRWDSHLRAGVFLLEMLHQQLRLTLTLILFMTR